jgi:hypothetical protein
MHEPGGAMRLLLFIVISIGVAQACGASCIDPSTLVHSTVGVTREFTDEERKAAPDLLGVRGTGWFLSPRAIVTAAHVAEAMRLSRSDWTQIELREQDRRARIAARILRFAGAHAEKMAVLELRDPFPSASALAVRTDPLTPEEHVVSLAYPDNRLRFAQGRFVEYGASAPFSGAVLLEMHDGNDRLVLDHGASGAPVLDCNGRVVAVVATLITQVLHLPSGAVRVSTAWQVPNVVSMSVDALRDIALSE